MKPFVTSGTQEFLFVSKMTCCDFRHMQPNNETCKQLPALKQLLNFTTFEGPFFPLNSAYISQQPLHCLHRQEVSKESFLCVCLFLTLAGPTPTNISRNSEPLTVMNGTLASPAVALARRVFPVPGGPVKMAPYTHNKHKH